MKTRVESLAILNEYTKSESLIRHALGVEACMLWYAKHFEQSEVDTLKWGITGLLHDFDYEMFPDSTSPDGHPYKGNQILEELGYEEDIRTAIMGHATYTGVARETLMAKTLFAVDELSGFITACSLVRPDKSIANVKVKSAKKKLKTLNFAAGCDRADIRLGAEELEIEMDQHIANVIEAMSEL